MAFEFETIESVSIKLQRENEELKKKLTDSNSSSSEITTKKQTKGTKSKEASR